jgi:hypothetical protein
MLEPEVFIGQVYPFVVAYAYYLSVFIFAPVSFFRRVLATPAQAACQYSPILMSTAHKLA